MKTRQSFDISRFKRAAAPVLAAILAILTVAPKTHAGTLSTDVPGMFPKDVGEFAYADLKSARQFPWFSALREQILPTRFRDFEKFLATAGIDPTTQVDELAWASMAATSKDTGEQVVGVALGSFNPSSSEESFKQQKLPMFDVKGYHLYAFGSGANAEDLFFTFIDSNTAAFGNRAALGKMIDVRNGGSDSLLRNDQLFPLINETNGSGLIWAVLDQSHTHLGVSQLLPEMSQFPQASAMIQHLKSMTISIDASSGVDAKFQTVCASTDDANLLGAALQAGILYKKYQESQSPSQSDLAAALDQVSVTPSGDRLKIDIPISQDQLQALIRSKAFATTL